jgi:hypothetical protein
VQKRRALSLVELDVKASRQERAAYNSITQQDELLVAWIIAQPILENVNFYSAAYTLYYIVSILLERARTLGNYAA